MFQNYYWGSVRKAVTAFGLMFSNICIDRTDDNGNTIQSLRVPLSYAPKQKALAKIQGSPQSFEQSFQVILPRMSFEITNLYYDSQRKLGSLQQVRVKDKTNPDNMTYQYAPVPWTLNMALYIYGKNQDDTLQIVEQILPYFTPDYNLNLNALNVDLDIVNDLPITIGDISFDDTYEGDLNDARMIIWTLNFRVKLNFYGPSNTKGVIKRANVNTYSNLSMSANLMNYVAEVSPFTANVTDNYSIVEFIKEF